MSDEEVHVFFEEIAWDRATSVFVGTVSSAEVMGWIVPDDLPAGSTAADVVPVAGRVRYTVRVGDVWKGTPPSEIFVFGGGGVTSCDRMLSVGETYVFYLPVDTGDIVIGSCTRITSWIDARRDLEQLARRREGWRGKRSRGALYLPDEVDNQTRARLYLHVDSSEEPALRSLDWTADGDTITERVIGSDGEDVVVRERR